MSKGSVDAGDEEDATGDHAREGDAIIDGTSQGGRIRMDKDIDSVSTNPRRSSKPAVGLVTNEPRAASWMSGETRMRGGEISPTP